MEIFPFVNGYSYNNKKFKEKNDYKSAVAGIRIHINPSSKKETKSKTSRNSTFISTFTGRSRKDSKGDEPFFFDDTTVSIINGFVK